MASNRTMESLWEAIDNLEMGLIRNAMGPGTIKNKMIRPKSIYAGTIDVSNLESVNTKTGNLSVTGNITMTTGGALSSGQVAWDSGVGFWLDYNAGTPRFSLGNSGGSKLTWNGTTLAITGTITATAGLIGGWTISGDDLTAGSGTSSIGLSPSGSVRIWSGNATPSSAPFQVDSLGNLTATAGAIGGWTIDSTLGLKLGTGASTRGISTGATAFYAGSATPSSAPFNVSTAGALSASNISVTGGTITGGTITASLINAGTLTFNGGGTLNGGGATVAGTLGNTGGTLNLGKLTVAGQITLGSGGSIVDADGSLWDQNGIILVSAGAFGDSITWKVAGTTVGGLYADANTFFMRYKSTGAYLGLANTSWVLGNASTHVSLTADTGGTGLYVAGRTYPGKGTGASAASQASYYIDAGTSGAIITNGIGIGGMLGISSGNTINLINPGAGGSAANWSSFTTADIPDKSAGYFVIQIGGTNYRVPFYANG